MIQRDVAFRGALLPTATQWMLTAPHKDAAGFYQVSTELDTPAIDRGVPVLLFFVLALGLALGCLQLPLFSAQCLLGHTLGLRHNFRASTIYTLEQIKDPAFTKANGVTTSVMDYTPYNISPKGERQGEFVMSTLGPYDYWAIEYGYKPLDPATEKAELAKIASRSTEPQLAFATDEDAGYGTMFIGIDPDVNRFDLGSDPIGYYKRTMKLSRELWDRLQDMKLADGESYERLTRSFASGFRTLGRVAPLAAKYVGGVTTRRDRAGTGRALFEPVPAARQREALSLIAGDFFSEKSFRFRPDFVGRLAIDQFQRPVNPDISLSNTAARGAWAAARDAHWDAVNGLTVSGRGGIIPGEETAE